MQHKAASRAPTLSRLIVEALVKIGLTQEEILNGPITHNNLAWQVPPLIVEEMLFDAPFSEYIDMPVSVQADNLYTLWADALAGMRNHPARYLTPEGYRNASAALPNARDRQLHLSLPDAFPAAISEYAGVTLSLECAHLLHKHGRVKEFVSNDDDYYAVLEHGMKIGVQAGLPALCSEQWDLPVLGLVQELLRTPRGAVWEGCDYDVIARVRSVCYTYRKSLSFFEGLDWALQALRVMGAQKYLLDEVRRIKATKFMRESRRRTLAHALEVSLQVSITDRQRIETLRSILVPEVMNLSAFAKKVYPYSAAPPPMLSDRMLVKLQAGVRQLYDDEERLYAPIYHKE